MSSRATSATNSPSPVASIDAHDDDLNVTVMPLPPVAIPRPAQYRAPGVYEGPNGDIVSVRVNDPHQQVRIGLHGDTLLEYCPDHLRFLAYNDSEIQSLKKKCLRNDYPAGATCALFIGQLPSEFAELAVAILAEVVGAPVHGFAQRDGGCGECLIARADLDKFMAKSECSVLCDYKGAWVAVSTFGQSLLNRKHFAGDGQLGIPSWAIKVERKKGRYTGPLAGNRRRTSAPEAQLPATIPQDEMHEFRGGFRSHVRTNSITSASSHPSPANRTRSDIPRFDATGVMMMTIGNVSTHRNSICTSSSHRRWLEEHPSGYSTPGVSGSDCEDADDVPSFNQSLC